MRPNPQHPLVQPSPSPGPCWPPADADHLLVTAAQMAGLEEQLFASGLPVAALMEKAALAMATSLLAEPDRSRPVLVLVGPGHNGGDGLVIARELHLAGREVRLWAAFARHRPLTEQHLKHARWLGIPCLEAVPEPGDGALWIDALFGIGQNRPPGEALEALLEERQRLRPGDLLAVDGPTGLCADSGRLLGQGGATAGLTWSIGLIKRGFVQDPALDRIGRLQRIELGLPPSLLASLHPSPPLALRATDRAGAPHPRLDPAAAKYGRGRLLVVAGSQRFQGAASLALKGASASGCGSIRAILPRELAPHLWLQHPHVVLEADLNGGPSQELDLADLPPRALERLDAVLLGPGLGPSRPGSGPADAQERLAALWQTLQDFPGLLVLDADGLNRLVARGEAKTWLQSRRGTTWITPHPGEFQRLFPQLADKDNLDAALEAARSSGATVLLKGARTVVAAPDGRRWQLLEAAAEAARAGLGDVLAGYAAGRGAMALAATGASGTGAVDGALLAAAALEHAQAGLHCLESIGAGGVTPMAVASALASIQH